MSKKFFTLGMALFIMHVLQAQVTFIIDSLPNYTPPGDVVFIAGDFQGWNPGHPEFALQKNSQDQWYYTSEPFSAGTTIQFKFTRGSWETVEKGEFGEEIPNRQFTFGTADTLHIIIFNWADSGGGGGNSTAADNVVVMDEDFFMPQLNRYRRIWLYLPPDYETSDEHYPVIYMHDGQNLFDTFTAFSGEWEVDETLNDLFNQGYQVPIVVGIDNGGDHRIDEYTPWANPQYGGGNGGLYVSFIVETLKPFIDENYRTLPNRQSTGIWGSSIGGLISFYAALQYQEVFEKAGVYSPSFWFSDEVWSFVQQQGHQQNMRLYQMTGNNEGGTQVTDTWRMHDTLTMLGFDSSQLSTQINNGQHNELLWRSDFETAYLWLFHSYANGISEHRAVLPLNIFPNPAAQSVTFSVDLNERVNKVMVFSMNGHKVYESTVNSNAVDVSNLSSGNYILEVITQQSHYRGSFVKQ